MCNKENTKAYQYPTLWNSVDYMILLAPTRIKLDFQLWINFSHGSNYLLGTSNILMHHLEKSSTAEFYVPSPKVRNLNSNTNSDS